MQHRCYIGITISFGIFPHYLFQYICNVKNKILYTYRQKMLFSFVLLFTFVVGTVAIFQHYNETRLKSEQLQERLVNYAELVSNKLIQSDENMTDFTGLFPQGLRITIIDTTGAVIFDNEVSDASTMENHFERPEVQEALITGNGFNVRYSNTLEIDYYYVAIKRQGTIIRTSMAYTDNFEETQLRPDKIFLYFIIILFVIVLFILTLISGKFSQAIEALREFSLQKHPDYYPEFPEGELGDIGRRIIHLHKKNNDQKQSLQTEKDKLIKHFHYSDVGIAIYTKDMNLVYNNALFIQYSSFIAPGNFEVHNILNSASFENINAFIQKKDDTSYEEIISISERSFEIKVIVFENFSFEIMISDITLAEKNMKIKREMTQNIAHELKTPVSTIKGYLETMQNVVVSPEKQQHFLQRAKLQADRLSELVTDIALITKMEESPNLYPKERVLLNDIIDQATDSSKLKVNIELNDKLYIVGSRNLLQTIFQNLIDNSNRYAGAEAEINIKCYLKDDEYYYFSVYDTGKGVPEQFLNRIFERFYRIDEGRNRNDGGTGLGLSLVKNAILIHNGDVQAKNRVDGGLEFLFTLSREEIS